MISSCCRKSHFSRMLVSRRPRRRQLSVTTILASFIMVTRVAVDSNISCRCRTSIHRRRSLWIATRSRLRATYPCKGRPCPPASWETLLVGQAVRHPTLTSWDRGQHEAMMATWWALQRFHRLSKASWRLVRKGVIRASLRRGSVESSTSRSP